MSGFDAASYTDVVKPKLKGKTIASSWLSFLTTPISVMLTGGGEVANLGRLS
jgi:hypothetical protein